MASLLRSTKVSLSVYLKHYYVFSGRMLPPVLGRCVVLEACACSSRATACVSTCPCLLIPSKKTGRGAATEMRLKDEWRLRESQVKTFTRQWAKRFGVNTGIEDMVCFFFTEIRTTTILESKM